MKIPQVSSVWNISHNKNLSFNLIDTLEPNIFTEVIWISFYFINPSQKASMFSIFSVSFSLSV